MEDGMNSSLLPETLRWRSFLSREMHVGILWNGFSSAKHQRPVEVSKVIEETHRQH